MEVLPLNGNQRQDGWRAILVGIIAITGFTQMEHLASFADAHVAPHLHTAISSYVQPFVVEKIVDSVAHTYQRFGLNEVRFTPAPGSECNNDIDWTLCTDPSECSQFCELGQLRYRDFPAFIDLAEIPPFAPTVFHWILSGLRTLKHVAEFSMWCLWLTLFGLCSLLLSLVSLVSLVMRIPNKVHRRFAPHKPKESVHVDGLSELTSALNNLSTNFQAPAAPSAKRRRLSWKDKLFATLKFFGFWILAATAVALVVHLFLVLPRGTIAGLAVLFVYWATRRPAPVPEAPPLHLNLRHVPMSSRSALVHAVLRQTRLGHYSVEQMYDAIHKATRKLPWDDRGDFMAQRPVATRVHTPLHFFKWFLTFNLDLAEIKARQESATQAALRLKDGKYRTYQDITALLVKLDALPYLYGDWRSVLKKIISQESFPKDVRRVLSQVAHQLNTLFEFFAILDAKWDALCPKRIQGIRVRKDNKHALVYSASPIAAAITTPTAGTTVSPFWVTLNDSKNCAISTAYMDLGSEVSIINRRVADRLGATFTSTGRRFQYQPVAAGPRDVAEHFATVSFKINGLNQRFTHTFRVDNLPAFPVIIGLPFWQEHLINALAGKTLEYDGKEIPLVAADVTRATVDDEDDSEVEDNLIPSRPEHAERFDALVLEFRKRPVNDGLPPQRPDDYRITIDPLKERAKNRPLPKYSKAAAEFLDGQVKEFLEKGLIRKSKEKAYAVALVIPKKNGSFRTVFDYRGPNEITKRLQTTLKDFRLLVTEIGGASIFSTIDLKSGYHQLRIHPDTIPYTAFKVPSGTYEWNVLPFGLCDAPQVFGLYMTQLLNPCADFCRVYLDDVLIFSANADEHQQHVRRVLDILYDNDHVVNWEKSVFARPQVEWVGHLLSQDGIAAQDTTIGQIQAMAVPRSKTDVKVFCGCVGYLENMIPNFADRAVPLTDLMKKNVPFNWSDRCQAAFDDLKAATKHLVPLQLFNPSAPIRVHVDASNFAVAAVLLQPDAKNPLFWRPIEFRSQKLDVHQKNWDIHTKEFFAIRMAARKYRYFLEGHEFQIFTDQKSIAQIWDRFRNPAALSEPLQPKHQRWLTELCRYVCDILYHPGEENVLADCYSRNPLYDQPSPAKVGAVLNVTIAEDWYSSMRDAYKDDAHFGEIYASLLLLLLPEEDDVTSPYLINPDNGLLYKDNRICVPTSKVPELLAELHLSVTAGHPGTRRMGIMCRNSYYFPKMQTFINNYVASCDVCSRTKPKSQNPAGTLQPVDPPEGRWTDIAMDLVTGLPPVEYRKISYDAVLTIVDKFSNRTHLYPVHHTVDAAEVLAILADRYIPLHGIPTSIQTDGGPQFKSRDYQSLLHHLGASPKIGVAYHQQSNGRVENRNKLLKTYLQMYVIQNLDWVRLLPMGEFVLNAQPSTSLDGRLPFEVDLGYIPHMPSVWTLPAADLSTRYAEDIREEMDRSLVAAKAAMNAAYEDAKIAFDRRRKDIEFSEGDEVFVDSSVVPSYSGVHNAGLEPKLRSKFLGPYPITFKESPVNYWLSIPGFQGPQVFHISQLRLKRSVPEGYFKVDNRKARKPLRFVNSEETKAIQGIFSHKSQGRDWLLSIKFEGSNDTETVKASQLVKTHPTMVVEYARKYGLSSLEKKYQKLVQA